MATLASLAPSGRATGATSGAAGVSPKLAELMARVQSIEQQPPAQQALAQQALAQRLSFWQRNITAELWQRLVALRGIASAAPPSLADVPAPLADRFVGKHGRHLMKVYARGAVWDMDALASFVAEVNRVDPNVTGHPVQTYHASRQMQTSYIHAAVYALLALLIVLMIDFRSLRYSLLAIAPMLLGLLLMFGLMGLFDIPLNPANMIVLPLVLGIGIDDGVHVLHDFRQQEGRYRLSASTATALVITSATTVAGFGSMMLVAQHQGLRSLGQVLTIGVLCCLVTSLLLLPAALTLISRRREADGEAEPAGDEEPATAASDRVGVVATGSAAGATAEDGAGQQAEPIPLAQSPRRAKAAAIAQTDPPSETPSAPAATVPRRRAG
jgi:hypothetical protein